MKRRDQSKSGERAPTASLGKSIPAGAGHAAPSPAQFVGASSGWVIALALVLIALAAVAAFHNSFAGDFVFDDYAWIVENRSIGHLWPIWQVLFPPNAVLARGRPVVSLTLAVNYALGGTNVWGYHAVNLAIHILAAWTLFGITRRTLSLPRLRDRFGPVATPLALVVAVLWTVHPLQTEAITYIIQRTEALVGLFYLLVLYCVIRGATSSRSKLWYVAAAAACLLGMATKELMATVPAIVLLYDRTFLAGSFREAWRRRYGLYLAMAAGWGIVAAALISTNFYGGTTGFAVQKFTWWKYLLTQPGVLVHYLRLAFWPSGLCLDYNWPPAQTVGEVLFPGVVVLGLLGLTLWALVKRPAWGFLGAWFFVILAPTSSFVPIKDAAFEHRMYLSLAAVVAGVTMGGCAMGQWLVGRGTIRPSAWRIASVAIAALAGVALGILTVQRNAVYENEALIWQDAVDKAPDNERAHNNLGLALTKYKRIDEAAVHYHRALEIKPDFADAHNNLGLFLAERGRLDEAIAEYQKAIENKADFAEAYNNFGLVLARRGQFGEAAVQYQRALKIKPDLADAYSNLGNALTGCGRVDEAVTQYRKALDIKPDCVEAHYNLGVTWAGRGKIDEAIAEYRKTLEIKPDYMQALNNLGALLVDCGRVDEAIVHYQKALEIKPDFAEAHNNLGLALAKAGRTNEAVTHYQKALTIKPDYAEAHYNFGLVLAAGGQLDEAGGHFRKALEIKPDYADAHDELGIALAKRDQLDEALMHFNRALEIKPDCAEVHNNLGIALAQRGRFDEAVAHFRKAIEIKPDFADARANLALALNSQGKAH